MWQNGDSNLHLLIQVHTPFLLTLCRALHYVLGIQKWWWHALSKWSMNSEKAGANKINYTNTAWVRKLIFLSSSSPHSYSLHNLIGWAEHPSFPFHSLIDSFIYWSILPFIHEFIGFFSNHTNTSLFMGSLPQARQYCCCVYAIVGSPVQYVSRIEGDVYAHTHLSPCTFAGQTDGKMNKGCEEGICRKYRREKHKKMPSPHSRFIAILPNARAALGINISWSTLTSHHSLMKTFSSGPPFPSCSSWCLLRFGSTWQGQLLKNSKGSKYPLSDPCPDHIDWKAFPSCQRYVLSLMKAELQLPSEVL